MPIVSITQPENGSVVLGEDVLISVDASDNVGIDRVEFYLDSGILLAADEVSPYSLAWNSEGVANGWHNLYAGAVDIAGNVATSLSHQIYINNGGVDGDDDRFIKRR